MKIKESPETFPERFSAICSSETLEDGGLGIRFEVTDANGSWPAFVVRHSRGISAYINRCAHLALELDWDKGLFFDVDGQHLICATHGALYTADTGKCISGPCNGPGLESLQVVEERGNIYVRDPKFTVRVVD